MFGLVEDLGVDENDENEDAGAEEGDGREDENEEGSEEVASKALKGL